MLFHCAGSCGFQCSSQWQENCVGCCSAAHLLHGHEPSSARRQGMPPRFAVELGTDFKFNFPTNGAQETCPLCIEELDDTDKDFYPCPCG